MRLVDENRVAFQGARLAGELLERHEAVRDRGDRPLHAQTGDDMAQQREVSLGDGVDADVRNARLSDALGQAGQEEGLAHAELTGEDAGDPSFRNEVEEPCHTLLELARVVELPRVV